MASSSHPKATGNAAPSSDLSRRAIHASACLRLRDDAHVAIGGSGPPSAAADNDGTEAGAASAALDGASCARGASNDAVVDGDEGDEQEEMFVTSDPALGVGTVREWGGPRRGGALAEPTRFGDWERKGRCTDF
jgi:hypothetical protein